MNKLWILAFVVSMGSGKAVAQDLKSIVSGVAGALTGNKTVTVSSLEGTWTYIGPDCKFTSESLLAKAGGEVVAQKVEEKMSSVLCSLGFTDGCSFTFNTDGTYVSTVKGRSVNGTYEYDEQTKNLLLKTKLGLKFTAEVSQQALSPGKMSLLFNADKLMSLVKAVGGAVGESASSSAVSSVNSLLKEYDGLMIGFELKKQ